MINPATLKPTGTFAKALEAEPKAEAGLNTFRIALFNNGAQVGLLGQDSGGWAILVSDVSKALTLELYPFNHVNYYRIKGSDRYMSVSNGHYVGFYAWGGARGFDRIGPYLISQYNSQALSYDQTNPNPYLYCWNDYTILEVKFDYL